MEDLFKFLKILEGMQEGPEESSFQTFPEKPRHRNFCLLRLRLSTPASLLYPAPSPAPSPESVSGLDAPLEGCSFILKYFLTIHTTSPPLWATRYLSSHKASKPSPYFSDTPYLFPLIPSRRPHCPLIESTDTVRLIKHASLPTAAPSPTDAST